jgi:hypothetical protein
MEANCRRRLVFEKLANFDLQVFQRFFFHYLHCFYFIIINNLLFIRFVLMMNLPSTSYKSHMSNLTQNQCMKKNFNHHNSHSLYHTIIIQLRNIKTTPSWNSNHNKCEELWKSSSTFLKSNKNIFIKLKNFN